MSPPTDLEPGAVFDGRYRIVRQIGAGGMGAVYEALQLKTDRPRALKVMHASTLGNEQLRARFAREAKIIAGVESDHIVPVLHVGAAPDGTPFIVMPFLKGESLEDRLKRERFTPLDLVLKVACEVADGLAAAHAQNLHMLQVAATAVCLEAMLREPTQAEAYRAVLETIKAIG